MALSFSAMKWYRSLYWRVALGVVAFLAAMLVVQAVIFLWAVSQTGRTLPGQSPARLATSVALDLANLLERDPHADLARYVRDQYARDTHPFFVLMSDGRMIPSGSGTFPDALVRMARDRLLRGDLPRPPRFLQAVPGERPPGPRFEPGGRGDFLEGNRPGRFARPSPIMVGGHMAGVVVVPPQTPISFLVGRFGPLLAIAAAGVLVVGTIMTSLLIFGPARRRLRELELAARRLGAGDLTARAPDRGGDEVAAVASAFNAMAIDLAARAEALAASDRLRRQLLADVSHELNTPMTAIRGYLETLSMGELALDEKTRARYLTIIVDETGRVERLIGDLLDLARLEGGGTPLRMERIAVADLFARVTARHERNAADAGVLLSTLVEPGAEQVLGDRDRLEQALQNLAANAVRYAPRASTVRLVAKAAGSGVSIEVEDEGPGIPPNHLPHVFDRFYKADSSRGGTSSGSGLGLSIVKAIVERHGGRISARSTPGHTIFEIAGLPYALGPAPLSQAESPAQQRGCRDGLSV